MQHSLYTGQVERVVCSVEQEGGVGPPLCAHRRRGSARSTYLVAPAPPHPTPLRALLTLYNQSHTPLRANRWGFI